MNRFRMTDFRSRLLKPGLFILTTLALAAAAEACSVCGVAKEEARSAYYATTAVMSLAPLALIGGIAFFIVKKSR